MKGSAYLNQVITALSCSHCTRPEDFYNLTILESLKQIREGTHKDLVLWLRSLSKGATQNKRKKELPVFFYSGILSQNGDSNIQAYSGVVIAEIDVPKDSEVARRELLANPHILAIFRSVRGQNYSVLVPVSPIPKNPEEYEAASQQVFEMLGDHLVGAGDNSSKRYRTASYDPDLFINPDSVSFPIDYSGLNSEHNTTSSAPSPQTIPSEDRELCMTKLAGSLIFKRTSLSALESALQQMNKNLFEEPLLPEYISRKAQEYYSRFEPRPGENVKHFQARILKQSVHGGEGKSGKPADVRQTSLRGGDGPSDILPDVRQTSVPGGDGQSGIQSGILPDVGQTAPRGNGQSDKLPDVRQTLGPGREGQSGKPADVRQTSVPGGNGQSGILPDVRQTVQPGGNGQSGILPDIRKAALPGGDGQSGKLPDLRQTSVLGGDGQSGKLPDLRKTSVPGGDGQSGRLPDLNLSKVLSSYPGVHSPNLEKPASTHARPETNGKHMHSLKPEPKEHNGLDLGSVFYAELDRISQEYKYVVNVHLYQQLVRPLIVSLCSAHENIILRISTAIRDMINRGNSDTSLELTLEDLVGDLFFDRAKKYFEHVLRCPFDLNQTINQGLKDLESIRDVIVHQHAWIDKRKNEHLYTRIENGQIKGVTIKDGELILRIDYAVSAVNLIMEHLDKLIPIVKERYPILPGRNEKQSRQPEGKRAKVVNESGRMYLL